MTKVGIVAFLLLAAEFVARFGCGLGDPPLSEGDADIDYIFRPNQACSRFGNRIRYNSLSMRMDSELDCRARLFVVGDSVVNGGALTDQASLATTLLQRDTEKYQVCNVSAGSWGPGNYAAYFRRHAALVRTNDVLVLEMSTHDLWEDDPREGAGGIVGSVSFPDKKPFCALSDGWGRYVWPRIVGLFRRRSRNRKIDVVPTAKRERLESFNLGELEYLYSLPFCKKYMMFFRSRKESAIPNDIPVLAQRMLDHAKAHGVNWFVVNLEDGDYRDSIHPTEEGQRKMAEAIRRAVGLW